MASGVPSSPTARRSAIPWWATCFFIPLTLFSQERPRAEILAEQIAALKQELATAGALPGAGPESARILTQREGLMWELIAIDPAKALAAGLPRDLAAQVRGLNPGSPVESEGYWEGELGITVADDFAGRRSITQWYLETSAERLDVFFAGPHPHGSGRVRLRGIRVRNRIAAAASEPRVSLQPANSAPACRTIGPQNIAVLMVTTPANPSFPSGYTSSYFEQAFFGTSSGSVATDSVNHYWKEASYGQTSATGQVFGPYALPQNYSCDQSGSLAAAAVNAADSTVDFTKYSRVAITFPIQSCSFGGLSTIGCGELSSPSKGNLTESTSWYPIFSYQQTGDNLGIFAHELGHALGLNHSSSADYGPLPLGAPDDTGKLVEYGDPFSVMGNSGGVGQYVAEHKSQILHWLGPSGYQEALSGGTWKLLPLESASGTRALRVLRDPVTSSWLWIEYRQPIGDVDGSFTQLENSGQSNVFDGVLVHYENPNIDSLHSYLLDFTAVSTPNNFDDSALVSGRSWSDPFSPLTLTVAKPSDGVLPVTVTYDHPCAALAFSSTTFPAAGGSGTLTITAGPTCAWSASTSTSWITFPGVVSGQGNGTVSFKAAANSGAQQRSGHISAQRQSVRLIQTGSGPSVASLSPAYGSGNTGQFAFQFKDPLGYADLSAVTVSFQGSPGCSVTMYSLTSGAYAYLYDDAGNQSGPLYLNAPGTTLYNGQCTISASGSSVNGSGNSLQVTLQMNFFPAFAGSHRITASVSNSGGTSPEVPVGTWTVPVTQQPSVTIQASTPGAPFQLDHGSTYQAPVTFYWAAGTSHTIAWLSLGGQSGARYVFQNWTDGGSNPRTITVSSVASVTYTADVKAQYLLTVTQAPAAAGTVTIKPASADGFYDAGTAVQLTPVSGPGYYFWYFGGDLSGSSIPQTITMSAPRSVTANYYCGLTFPAYPNSPEGPGPAIGLAQWQTGAGCKWSISSDETWLTLSGALSGTGSGSVFYKLTENTGASRSASITLMGDSSEKITVTQEASISSRPSITSFSPSAGGGANQIFTAQAWDPHGYQKISQVDLTFTNFPAGGNACYLVYEVFGASPYLFLEKDDNSGYLSLALPSTGTIANSRCQVNGGQFSISGAGNTAIIKMGMTFFPAYSGDKLIAVNVVDSTSGLASAYTYAGHWYAGLATQTIAFAALSTRTLGSGSFALSATATSGLTVTFASNSKPVCTVSGVTVTLVAKGTCSITASQPGNLEYSAATSVIRTFIVSAGPPAIVSLSPNPGTGTMVTFKETYSDPNGAGDLSAVLLQVNNVQSSANACYVYYQPQGNHLYLASNAGAWMTPALTPGVAGTASNSQCTLNAGSSSVTTAGNDLSLSVALTFSGTFVGAKNVYLYAAGLSGQNSGWIKEGAWMSTSAPAIVSLSPNAGAGTSVTFKAVYADPKGAGDLSEMLLQVNATQSSANACYVYFQPKGNHLYLASNAGNAWLTPALTPGVAGTASNSQCTLNAGSSSVTTAGNDLTLSVALTFSGTFVGAKNVYLYAAGLSGQNSGWIKEGTWMP